MFGKQWQRSHDQLPPKPKPPSELASVARNPVRIGRVWQGMIARSTNGWYCLVEFGKGLQDNTQSFECQPGASGPQAIADNLTSSPQAYAINDSVQSATSDRCIHLHSTYRQSIDIVVMGYNDDGRLYDIRQVWLKPIGSVVVGRAVRELSEPYGMVGMKENLF